MVILLAVLTLFLTYPRLLLFSVVVSIISDSRSGDKVVGSLELAWEHRIRHIGHNTAGTGGVYFGHHDRRHFVDMDKIQTPPIFFVTYLIFIITGDKNTCTVILTWLDEVMRPGYSVSKVVMCAVGDYKSRGCLIMFRLYQTTSAVLQIQHEGAYVTCQR